MRLFRGQFVMFSQAAIAGLRASYRMMKARKYNGLMKALQVKTLQKAGLLAAISICSAAAVRAQDANGPLTPPPEHDVHRVTTTQPVEPPPAMAPAEIVKAFAEKEEQYAKARGNYGYKKTIKLTEFGNDGQPSGEFQLTVAAVVDSEGRAFEKVIDQPTPTLRAINISPGDLKAIARIPAYPLVRGQLSKYELRFVGSEKVDEIDCYIFEAKPKLLERANALFQGVVWVDKQYLEVVKTYGKWVTDLGDMKAAELPFVNFETYRENVDGKYWFPDYARSDGYLHFKDTGNIPVRLVIKWAEFKPLTAGAPPTKAAPAGADSEKP